MTRFIVSETHTPNKNQQTAQAQLLEAAIGKIPEAKVVETKEKGKNYLVESSMGAVELATAISSQLDNPTLKNELAKVAGLEQLIKDMKQNLSVNQAQ